MPRQLAFALATATESRWYRWLEFITQDIDQTAEGKHPFVWVKTADQVLRRYNQKPISGPVH
jgi:hypothetical protein